MLQNGEFLWLNAHASFLHKVCSNCNNLINIISSWLQHWYHHWVTAHITSYWTHTAAQSYNVIKSSSSRHQSSSAVPAAPFKHLASVFKNTDFKLKLQSTHRVQTSANADCYLKAYSSKHVINIHPQLFQLILMPKMPYLSIMQKWKNWTWIQIQISPKI